MNLAEKLNKKKGFNLATKLYESDFYTPESEPQQSFSINNIISPASQNVLGKGMKVAAIGSAIAFPVATVGSLMAGTLASKINEAMNREPSTPELPKELQPQLDVTPSESLQPTPTPQTDLAYQNQNAAKPQFIGEFVGEKTKELNPVLSFVLSTGAEMGIGNPLVRSQGKMLSNLIGDRAAKIVKQNIRIDKFNLSSEQALNLEKISEALGLGTRKVRSFNDMQQLAFELGTNPKTLLKLSKKPISDAENIALKNLVNEKSNYISEAGKLRTTLENRLSTETLTSEAKQSIIKEIETLNNNLTSAENELNIALAKNIRGLTEAGRTVVSNRILANRTTDPSFWLERAKRMLGDRKLTSEMSDAIIDLSNKKDLVGLTNYVSLLRKPSWTEKAISLWKAGLLSNPTSHLSNIGGNVAMFGLETASDFQGAVLDKLFSLVTKKRTTAFTPQIVGEKIKGFTGSGKAIKKYLKTGIYDESLLKKWDLPRRTNFNNKILDTYVNGTFAVLGAEDIPFRMAALRSSLANQATVIAKNLKLTGQDFKNKVKELLLKPTDEMARNATEAADVATFQNKNILSTGLSSGQKAMRNMGSGGAAIADATELIMPFKQTPTNVVSRAIDYSPSGFIKAIVNQIRPSTRGQANLVKDISKAMTGTEVSGLGYWLYKNGQMTGSQITPQEEAEGKKPNSVFIAGAWRSIPSPLVNLLTLGAEAAKSEELTNDPLKRIFYTGASGLKGLKNQTFLKGVSGALSAVDEADRYGASFVNKMVGSSIPSVLSGITRSMDTTQRNPETMLETIKTRIPGLSQSVAPKRDIFGEKMEGGGGRLSTVDFMYSSKETKDPIKKAIISEAKNLNVEIGYPEQIIRGIKLDNHEFGEYMKVVGKTTKRDLSDLINSDEYKSMNSVEKERAFRNTITQARKDVMEVIFPDMLRKKFNLSQDIDDEDLIETVSELGKNKKFRSMNLKDQEKKIKQYL